MARRFDRQKKVCVMLPQPLYFALRGLAKTNGVLLSQEIRKRLGKSVKGDLLSDGDDIGAR